MTSVLVDEIQSTAGNLVIPGFKFKLCVSMVNCYLVMEAISKEQETRNKKQGSISNKQYTINNKHHLLSDDDRAVSLPTHVLH